MEMYEFHDEANLNELKLKIKDWEHAFYELNLRKPSKEDIQAASSEVKGYYKTYWELKKKKEKVLKRKDDIWSEKFNKSNLKNTTSKCLRGDFKRICAKIQEKSLSLNSKDEQLKSPVLNQKKLLLSFNNSFNQETSDNNSNSEQVIQSNNLDSDLEIIKSSVKISKNNQAFKKINSVNVLHSPSVNLNKFKKNLSFNADLDSDWLERCSESALKQPESLAGNVINGVCLPQDCKTEANHVTENSNEASNLDTPLCLSSDYVVSGGNNASSDDALNSEVKNSFTKFSRSSFSSVSAETSSVKDCFKNDLNEKSIVSSPPSVVKGNSKTENDVACLPASQSCCKLSEKRPADSSETTFDESKIKKRKLTRSAVNSSHLERKIATGRLNENFVKVNIRKKKFSRGHRTVNVKKLKWQKWKSMKSAGAGSANESMPSACFKCGQIGHWARNCKALPNYEKLSETTMEDIDDDTLPTLEQAAELAKKAKTDLTSVAAVKNITSSHPSVKVDEQALENICDSPAEETVSNGPVKPIFELAPDGELIETPSEVYDALSELGYTSFRKGQETAVMRILSGLSTLVVLPTGSGKTLCYQLPAYIYGKKYNCCAIVISPLVSLMEDQVTGLAKGLHAVCLHSGMSDIKKKASIEDLNSGKAQILLVSPEAVIGGLAYGIPPISFACIDEAHCLSQWSHNFRPSYLQLHKVLTQRMKVKCILGLTATANLSSIKEIASHLRLENIEDSVIGSTGIPDNLHLSVSRDKDKDKALIKLLCGDRFKNCSSIIIYCIRRDETERLAALIRTCLQDHLHSEEQLPVKKPKAKDKKRKFMWTAEAYHAGLAPPRRHSIQKKFMTGKLRVVVATVAFGMGLDMHNIHAVIHYNMPKSFESYVQEIGRAGRDGKDSHCHLFLDSEGKDLQELKRHIYSNSTDRYVLRKLLKKVFPPCQCKNSSIDGCLGENQPEIVEVDGSTENLSCPKHEVAFPINDAVQELDLKEENILTVLCYLELHSKQWIEVLPPTYATCIIRCYGGPRQLRGLASKSAPVAAAFALDANNGKKLENISTYQFPVVEVASVMGWNTSSVKRELKRLEWNDQNRKTGVIIEFTDLAFHVKSPGNLSGIELDDILNFLHQKVTETEKTEVKNLESLFSIFTKCSFPHYWACCDEAPLENSKAIKDAVNRYFDETGDLREFYESNALSESENNSNVDLSDVCSQIRDMIYTNSDQNFTGRAIARIFHGIGSPCYPAEVWGRVRKFWRSLLHVDFNLLIKLAKEELLKSR